MAKGSAEIIREAVKGARDDFTKFTVAQEQHIYRLFREASNELVSQISRFTREGKIPPARLMVLLNEVKTEMDRLRPRLRGVISRSQKKAVDHGITTSIVGAKAVISPRLKAGIGTSFIDAAGKMRKYDAKKEVYAVSMWAKVNQAAVAALVRTKYGGITFSRRVWDVTWPVERQIRNQINLAAITGASADKVSRRIRSYLGLPDTFRGMAFKEFHPGAGVYKSAYKNALRLSATEINRGYVEGVLRYGKTKTWIKGYIWRTASGAPCPDCTDEEGRFFPKDEPPIIPLHPFCMCWPEISYEG